jgi:hypothetical protein
MKEEFGERANKKILDHDLDIEEVRMHHRDMKDELDREWKKLDKDQQKERTFHCRARHLSSG